MGVALYLAAKAKRRGRAGGPGGEHLWPGAAWQVCSAARRGRWAPCPPGWHVLLLPRNRRGARSRFVPFPAPPARPSSTGCPYTPL
jgi:hypothetical protein